MFVPLAAPGIDPLGPIVTQLRHAMADAVPWPQAKGTSELPLFRSASIACFLVGVSATGAQIIRSGFAGTVQSN